MSFTGNLDARGHPRITAMIRGPYGYHAAEVIVDTGFTGAVGLSQDLARQLGLLRRGVVPMEGPDGAFRNAPSYEVEVEWLDGPVRAPAVEIGISAVLLGAGMLHGRELRIDYGPAQSVEIR